MAEENQKTEGAAEDADPVKKKDGGDAAASAGPNQKFVFIALIVNSVVLLIVAALVAMNYLKQSKNVSLQDVAASSEQAPAEAHGGGDAHGGGGGHGGDDKKKEVFNRFVKETFTVNLADAGGSHAAKVDIEIEVQDPPTKLTIEENLPKIRDFIVVTLSSKSYDEVSTVEGREFLRAEIRQKINSYLPRGQVKDVYFTQFIVQ